ncbi:hypothetical protein HK101_000513 [Irineochytrium annulatum]|nr:hypothetical protein HK101_000513 [Irineochytrium annulatum]
MDAVGSDGGTVKPPTGTSQPQAAPHNQSRLANLPPPAMSASEAVWNEFMMYDPTVYHDATAAVREGCEKLAVGEYVHFPNFTLWDTMAAIEIMDPKMDNGMDLPKPHQGKMAVADVPGISMTPGRIIGIIDQLLCLEEEEYTLDNANFSLCPEVAEVEAIEGLLRMEDELVAKTKDLKAKGGKSVTLDDLSFPDGHALDYVDALLIRLRFRRFYLQALNLINKRNLPSAKKSVIQALAQLKLYRETLSLSEDVSDAFDPNINRLLYSDSPPRVVTAITMEEAYDDLHLMFSQLLEILMLPSGLPLTSLLGFSKRVPCPNVVTRSLLMSITLFDGKLFGKGILQDAIKESVVDYCKAPYFTSTESVVVGISSSFVDRAAKPFYLSSWIYHHKLQMLVDTQLMGFELEIFSPYEFPRMYIMLDHLFENTLMHLNRVKRFASSSANKPAETSKKKKPVKDASLKELMGDVPIDERMAIAKQLLARAMSQLTAVLCREKTLRRPHADFYFSEVQFNHRFETLLQLGSPPPMSFQQLQEIETDFEVADVRDILLLSYTQLEQSTQCLETVAAELRSGLPISAEPWFSDFQNVGLSTVAVSKLVLQEILNLTEVSKRNMEWVSRRVAENGARETSVSWEGWFQIMACNETT